MNIILLGAPGVGKDTFANKFMEKNDYVMISPGEIFRTAKRDNR